MHQTSQSKALTRYRLIATMLGRFRMNVLDCLKEYEGLSHEIFGKPRWISQRTVLVAPWPKYSAHKMEKVFQDVTRRRCENSAWDQHTYTAPTFPTIENTCATFVLSSCNILHFSSCERSKTNITIGLSRPTGERKTRKAYP